VFKKKKPKYQQITNVQQIKAHLREFILDSQIENGAEIAEDFGCPIISDELLEKEEEESHRRVDEISFLIPLLYGYSTLFADAFVSNMNIPHSDDPRMHKLIHELTDSTKQTFEAAMSHLLIGSVSQMVDLGLLKLPKRK
jgi:hypothetical protein